MTKRLVIGMAVLIAVLFLALAGQIARYQKLEARYISLQQNAPVALPRN